MKKLSCALFLQVLGATVVFQLVAFFLLMGFPPDGSLSDQFFCAVGLGSIFFILVFLAGPAFCFISFAISGVPLARFGRLDGPFGRCRFHLRGTHMHAGSEEFIFKSS